MNKSRKSGVAVIVGILLASLALLLPSTASAAPAMPSTAGAALAADASTGTEASGAPTCSTANYPAGKYFVVFVYRGGTKKYCSYPSRPDWVAGLVLGNARGVRNISGYSSLYIRDATIGMEINTHYQCPSATRFCDVTTATMNAGNSSALWTFDYTRCGESWLHDGSAVESQALRYHLQNSANVIKNVFVSARIFPPSGTGDGTFGDCKP